MGRIDIRLSILLFIGFGFSAELYDEASNIITLHVDNFTTFVQSHPTLVQFYLHTCGSCQDYAPVFKNLSKLVENWNWAVKIAVIDCSDPVNRNISNAYNVEYFPTFIFFLKGGKRQFIQKYYSDIPFREKISDVLVNEKQWDRLVPGMNISDAITVFGPNVSQVAMIILDTQLNIPTTLQSVIVGGTQYGVKDVLGNTIFTSEDVNAVKRFLLEKYQKFELKLSQPSNKPIKNTPKVVVNPIPHSLPVYAADIVASLQNLLTHDIALKKEIKGVELLALKEFLAVLSKYLDLGPQYNKEIAYLQETVAGQSIISREDWTELVAKLKLSTDEVNHIACRGSKPYLRGYPCGLWVMFHSMTVNRYLKNENPDDKAPIAHALNRFVPHFFSCGYCAFHFAKMTSNVRLPGEAIYPDRPNVVPPFPLEEPDPSTLPVAPKSARDEVLWLNIAHNAVNKRLSVNIEMPKEVFPSPRQCRACWSDEARAKIAEDKFAALPDRTEELLAYLVHHYRPSSWRWDNVYVSFEDISQLGYEGNFFSTFDLILVGVICLSCASALLALFALICCRCRCPTKRDHTSLPLT